MRLRTRLMPPAIAGLLLILLGALAVLQYRWIGRVSDMERQRLHQSLQASGARFTEDFDRELTRAFFTFHPEPSQLSQEGMQRAVRQLERWRNEAPWPGLVKDILVARRVPDNTPELFLLAAGARRFEPVRWPAQLAGLRQRLLAERAEHTPFPFEIPVDPRMPGLIVPLAFPPPSGAVVEESVLVVRLDEQVLANELFPELTRRHFGSPKGTDYSLAVLDAAERPVFRSDASVPLTAFHQADLRLGMLSLRPFHEMHGLWRHTQAAKTKRRSATTFVRIAPMGLRHSQESTGPWHLAIHHRQGSLEAAVAATRMRNLGVSLGILALLAATSGLMIVTTQRAQRLARQQIEFVASVTHELHTPLTAIRSAGQNLADGVVIDAPQVRRYGSLIEHEGRRLTDLVGHVLELAGIQSGRRVYDLKAEEVGGVIEGALEDCRGLLDEKKAQIEKDVPADLPPVLVDEAALRRALRNLIENAARHGNTGNPGDTEPPWIGVRARSAPGTVSITVEDRGPGIAREDLPHLFEPFYRGRGTSSNGVPGSGLGLSVVRHVTEALGGRVTLDNRDGRGSAFTLHLPVAPAGEKTA